VVVDVTADVVGEGLSDTDICAEIVRRVVLEWWGGGTVMVRWAVKRWRGLGCCV
jgi:hypothetical protein